MAYELSGAARSCTQDSAQIEIKFEGKRKRLGNHLHGEDISGSKLDKSQTTLRIQLLHERQVPKKNKSGAERKKK